MTLFALSDASWVNIVGSVCTTLVTLGLFWKQVKLGAAVDQSSRKVDEVAAMTITSKNAAQNAAQKAADVGQSIKSQLKDMKCTSSASHAQLQEANLLQLQLLAKQAARIAEMTGKPEDRQEAEATKQRLDEFQAGIEAMKAGA